MAPIRLNPQFAMRKMQNRFRRSSPELRGPRQGLEMGPPRTQPSTCALVKRSRRSRPASSAARGYSLPSPA
eukprot:7052421-Alexandrium_andersonii.AAC.1